MYPKQFIVGYNVSNMISPPLELIIVLALIVFNGLLSMAEIAIVSARRARLQQMAQSGDMQARVALDLAQAPDDFLSAVQIGITLVGIFMGAFGGATLATHLAEWFAQYPALAPYQNSLAIGVVVVVTTYFSLVLGELVPKRLALNNPEKIARAVARPMHGLGRLALPLVKFLTASTNLVLKIMKTAPVEDLPVTEEEIKVLIDQGTQAGVFEEAEQDMMEAILRLGDRRVETIMIPRTDIVWLDLEEPFDHIKQIVSESVHSRFPVGRGSLDDVVGVVLAKDLLIRCLNNRPLDLQADLIKPLYVPEGMPALKVFDEFRKTNVHIALVLDEYGELEGLVTIADIFQSIVGEIGQPGEPAEAGITEREDGTWLVDGMLPIDEFKDEFNLEELPTEDRGSFQTMGGLMMNYLGRIPQPADHFEWNNLRFEVIDMDGFRVDKILVARVPPEEPASE